MIILGGVQTSKTAQNCLTNGFRNFSIDLNDVFSNNVNFNSIFRINEKNKGLNSIYNNIKLFIIIEKEKIINKENQVNEKNYLSKIEEYLININSFIKQLIYPIKDLDYHNYLNKIIQEKNKEIEIKTISNGENTDYSYNIKTEKSIPVGYVLKEKCISTLPNYYRKKKYIFYIDSSGNLKKQLSTEIIESRIKESYLKYGIQLEKNNENNDWDWINMVILNEYRKKIEFKKKNKTSKEISELVGNKITINQSPCISCGFREDCQYANPKIEKCVYDSNKKIDILNNKEISEFTNDLMNDARIYYQKVKNFSESEAQKIRMDFLKLFKKSGINLNINNNINKEDEKNKNNIFNLEDD